MKLDPFYDIKVSDIFCDYIQPKFCGTGELWELIHEAPFFYNVVSLDAPI